MARERLAQRREEVALGRGVERERPAAGGQERVAARPAGRARPTRAGRPGRDGGGAGTRRPASAGRPAARARWAAGEGPGAKEWRCSSVGLSHIREKPPGPEASRGGAWPSSGGYERAATPRRQVHHQAVAMRRVIEPEVCARCLAQSSARSRTLRGCQARSSSAPLARRSARLGGALARVRAVELGDRGARRPRARRRRARRDRLRHLRPGHPGRRAATSRRARCPLGGRRARGRRLRHDQQGLRLGHARGRAGRPDDPRRRPRARARRRHGVDVERALPAASARATATASATAS